MNISKIIQLVLIKIQALLPGIITIKIFKSVFSLQLLFNDHNSNYFEISSLIPIIASILKSKRTPFCSLRVK